MAVVCTSNMEFKTEDGHNTIWDSFQTKVEDLFLAGYNLPQVLQITAVTSVEERLETWKSKLTLEEPGTESFMLETKFEVETAESSATEATITSANEEPKNLSIEVVNDDLRTPDVPTLETLANEYASNTGTPEPYPDPQTPIRDSQKGTSHTAESPERISIKHENGVQQSPTTSTPGPKRKRGRPPGSKNKSITRTPTDDDLYSPKVSKSLERPFKVEDEEATDFTPKSSSVRKRGRPPGSTKKKTQVQPSPDDMENDASDLDGAAIVRKRGRPPGSTKKKKLTRPPPDETDDDATDLDESGDTPRLDLPADSGAFVPRKPGRPKGSLNKALKKNYKGNDDNGDTEYFECEDCGKRYDSGEKLERHRLVHRKGPINCPNCPKQFQSISGYEVHMRLHTGEGLHKCVFCNYITGSSGMLTAHITRVHEKLRKHLCDTCGKGFVTSYMLRRHNEAIHQREKFKDMFGCDICEYKTHSEACLKSHVRNRHTETPGYVCNLCGITVKYKHSLFEHQQRHYSDKKCACPECPFKAICEADVRKHIRRHHRQGKKYICEVCSKGFKQKVHLDRHFTAIHTTDKNFPCSECTYRCNDKSNLAKHLWHVHKLKDRTKPVLMKFDREAADVKETSSTPVIVSTVSMHNTQNNEHVPMEMAPDESESMIAANQIHIETAREEVVQMEPVDQVEQMVISVHDGAYQMVQNVQYWS